MLLLEVGIGHWSPWMELDRDQCFVIESLASEPGEAGCDAHCSSRHPLSSGLL